MLFKLSLKNIIRSIKDYAIYFFTLILGVAVFYVFNAIESQTVMMKVSSSTHALIELLTNTLSGVSIFVSLILGFLIIYASRFLIKRRDKEFGVYLTLGMGKRKISFILFLETLCIGVLSLVVGLSIGVLLSQFMSILVANMFEADMMDFTFVFSSKAFVKTLIYFGIMYLFVMIFNIFSVSKCKLISLLHANKKSEKVKLKNPYLCICIFILAVIMLSIAYYMVTGGIEILDDFKLIMIPIALGSVSTFLIFWSLSGLLLKLLMSMKNVYYKGLNSFIIRQFSSKINTTVFSMTMICLMLFITICLLSSSLSIKNSMTKNLTTLAPIDIEITKNTNVSKEYMEDWNYTEEAFQDSKIPVRDTLKHMNFDIEKYFTDTVEFTTYQDENITIKDTLGESFETIKNSYPYLAFDSKESIVKISDYNKMAQLYGLKELTVKENEYIIVADYSQWISIRNQGLIKNTPIVLSGKTYVPKTKECENGFIDISSNHINIGFFVVPDEAVLNLQEGSSIFLANYKADSKEEKENIEEEITPLLEKEYPNNTRMTFNTKLDIYGASIGLGALVTFIGLYLGIIFLMISAAVLALKELSESSDNKERFQILRKIGTDEKMLYKALFFQIFIFFLFPLFLALIHSIFGMIFCNFILSSLGTESLITSIIMTALLIVFIYGGYFVITYFCSKNIIKERL